MKKHIYLAFYLLMTSTYSMEEDYNVKISYQRQRLNNKKLTANQFVINEVDNFYKELLNQTPSSINSKTNYSKWEQTKDKCQALLDVFFQIKPFKSSGKAASTEMQKKMYYSLFQLSQIFQKFFKNEDFIEINKIIEGQGKEKEHQQRASLFMLIAHAAGSNLKKESFLKDLDTKGTNDVLGTLFPSSQSKDFNTKKVFGFSIADKSLAQTFNQRWNNKDDLKQTIKTYFDYLEEFWKTSTYEQLKPQDSRPVKPQGVNPAGNVKFDDPSDFIKKKLETSKSPKGKTYAALIDDWKKDPSEFTKAMRNAIDKQLPAFKDEIVEEVKPPFFGNNSNRTRQMMIINTARYAEMIGSKYIEGINPNYGWGQDKKTYEIDNTKGKHIAEFYSENHNFGFEGFQNILYGPAEAFKTSRPELLSILYVAQSDEDCRAQQVQEIGIDQVKKQIAEWYDTQRDTIFTSFAFAQSLGEVVLSDYFRNAFPRELHCTASVFTLPATWLKSKAEELYENGKSNKSTLEKAQDKLKRLITDFSENHNAFIENKAPQMIDNWVLVQLLEANKDLDDTFLNQSSESLALLASNTTTILWTTKQEACVKEIYKKLKKAYEKELQHNHPEVARKSIEANKDRLWGSQWGSQWGPKYIPNYDPNSVGSEHYYKTTDNDIIINYKISKKKDIKLENGNNKTVYKFEVKNINHGKFSDHIGSNLKNFLANLYQEFLERVTKAQL